MQVLSVLPGFSFEYKIQKERKNTDKEQKSPVSPVENSNALKDKDNEH